MSTKVEDPKVSGDIVGSLPNTKKELDEVLSKYEKLNPEKYADKLANGEFDRLYASLGESRTSEKKEKEEEKVEKPKKK